MGGLISLAFRSLAARRGRTALSVVGIALGIGVLYASLAAPDSLSALVSQTLATANGISVDDTISLQGGAAGPVDLTVVGILRGDGPIVGSDGRTVVLPLRTMQRILDDPTVNRVDIVA